MHIINKLYGDWEIAQFINRLPCKHENLGFIPRNEKKQKNKKLGMLMLTAMRRSEKRGSCWPPSGAEQVGPGQETLPQNTRRDRIRRVASRVDAWPLHISTCVFVYTCKHLHTSINIYTQSNGRYLWSTSIWLHISLERIA